MQLFIIVCCILLLCLLIGKKNRRKDYSNNSQGSNAISKKVETEQLTSITDIEPRIVKTTGLKNEPLSIDGITIDQEQSSAFKILEDENGNYFITGKAGTGKSVLLQYFVRHTRKKAIVVAPTGVAALNVGGQTIHSFFGLAPSLQDSRDRSAVENIGQKKRSMMQAMETLVIDEGSMVSADVMDMIDAKLRYARNNDNPFGGCQVLLFGDLYQLPPVVKTGEEMRYLEHRFGTPFFFSADAVDKHPFEIIELQTIHRQQVSENDDLNCRFVEILNRIRVGQCNTEMIDFLNKHCIMHPQDDKYITLTGDNDTASRINHDKLSALPGKEYSYLAEYDANSISQSFMPTEPELKLKVGALVMMIKNDHTEKQHKPRWVNGTLGIISELAPASIAVEINGVSRRIEKEVWEKYQYDYNATTGKLEKRVVATFVQYPIKLAYAITIHKSQGQTFDAVKIDLRKGAFASGQTYVALSRCRSIESLYLSSPLKLEDVRVDPNVVKYMSTQKLYV